MDQRFDISKELSGGVGGEWNGQVRSPIERWLIRQGVPFREVSKWGHYPPPKSELN